jgi:hypothetical protein
MHDVSISRQTNTSDNTGDNTAELQLLTSGSDNCFVDAGEVMKVNSPN